MMIVPINSMSLNMDRRQLLFTAALLGLIVGGPALADPGSGGGQRSGSQSGGQPGEKPQYRDETKVRDQKQTNAPDTGKQTREQAEEAKRIREEAEGKGAQTSAEMQERSQERKQIQEEARAAGTESGKGQKKPWWKFWGDDDAS
jgi:hypothetical protein